MRGLVRYSQEPPISPGCASATMTSVEGAKKNSRSFSVMLWPGRPGHSRLIFTTAAPSFWTIRHGLQGATSTAATSIGRNRTPGWPPFVNSMPRLSNADFRSSTVLPRGNSPRSNRETVSGETPANSASSRIPRSSAARAILHWVRPRVSGSFP